MITPGAFTKPLIVFRFDASAEIGTGHLVRCGVLASAFMARGWNVWRAVSAETMHYLSDHVDTLIVPSDSSQEAEFLRTAIPGECALLVLDHYQRDATFERSCRPWARHILVLDDLADRRHDADWLIDPTPRRSTTAYRSNVSPHTTLLLGSEFALLDTRFADTRPASLKRRGMRDPVSRVLINPGGTDPHDIAGLSLDALTESNLDLEIDVALFPSAPHLARLQSRRSERIVVHDPAKNMAALMKDADFAIGAAGGSALERCCVGLPSLLIVTAENQRLNAATLAEAGAAMIVGDAGQVTIRELSEAICTLANDDPLRYGMASASAALCDGLGVRRVIERIERHL